MKTLIEIDDSGWGSLIGGVSITVCRVETGDHIDSTVDVMHFQNKRYIQKSHQKEATNLISSMLIELKLKPNEEILLCTCPLFNEAYYKLLDYGFNARRGKVSYKTDRYAKEAFRNYLTKNGVEKWMMRHIDYSLIQNFPKLQKIAKTGWPNYEKRVIQHRVAS